MPGTISQYQVVIPGQVITATLWNGMELNIINNGLIWSGIDDYSATDSEMQITTDPFPGSVISRPTSAQGELERVRFQIKNITGESQWYNDPDVTLAAAATFNTGHTHTGGADGTQIPTGGIADGAVTTAKLGSLAITNSQIADVAATKITGQVTTAQITDANVTTAKLASSVAINTLNINTLLNHKTFQSFPILQVLYYSTATAFSTASTSFVDTTLTGAITPKLSTSKILVWISGSLTQAINDSGFATIARGGTNLASTSAGFFTTIQNNNYSLSMVTYDSPATTSSITYSAQVRTNGAAALIHFPHNQAGNVGTATMILVEIAQ